MQEIINTNQKLREFMKLKVQNFFNITHNYNQARQKK